MLNTAEIVIKCYEHKLNLSSLNPILTQTMKQYQ
jgi:hypothetical protein